MKQCEIFLTNHFQIQFHTVGQDLGNSSLICCVFNFVSHEKTELLRRDDSTSHINRSENLKPTTVYRYVQNPWLKMLGGKNGPTNSEQIVYEGRRFGLRIPKL